MAADIAAIQRIARHWLIRARRPRSAAGLATVLEGLVRSLSNAMYSDRTCLAAVCPAVAGLASILYVCCLDDLGISGLAVLAAFGLTALDACLLGALGLVPAALG